MVRYGEMLHLVQKGVCMQLSQYKVKTSTVGHVPRLAFRRLNVLGKMTVLDFQGRLKQEW